MARNPNGARGILDHFRRRGGSILRSAAAERQDLATIGSTMQVVFGGPGLPSRMERSHLPRAELLEAATLLRPLYFNQSDSVYVTKVASALSTLAGDNEGLLDYTRDLRRQLPRILKSERWYLMLAAGGLEQRFSNTEIAELWFDAEVWHSDLDKQEALRHVGEGERLICATVWVSERLLLTKALLEIIDDLENRALL